MLQGLARSSRLPVCYSCPLVSSTTRKCAEELNWNEVNSKQKITISIRHSFSQVTRQYIQLVIVFNEEASSYKIMLHIVVMSPSWCGHRGTRHSRHGAHACIDPVPSTLALLAGTHPATDLCLQLVTQSEYITMLLIAQCQCQSFPESKQLDISFYQLVDT